MVELVAVVNGEEQVFDAAQFGISETTTEQEALSLMRTPLNELATDIPFTCKKVVGQRVSVSESGMVEEPVQKFFFFPNAPAGN